MDAKKKAQETVHPYTFWSFRPGLKPRPESRTIRSKLII